MSDRRVMLQAERVMWRQIYALGRLICQLSVFTFLDDQGVATNDTQTENIEFWAGEHLLEIREESHQEGPYPPGLVKAEMEISREEFNKWAAKLEPDAKYRGHKIALFGVIDGMFALILTTADAAIAELDAYVAAEEGQGK